MKHIESAYILLVKIQAPEALFEKRTDPLKRAALLAYLFFNLPFEPVFQSAGKWGEIPLASTNPQKYLPELERWDIRIDAVFYPDAIGLIVFKWDGQFYPRGGMTDWLGPR